MKHETEETNRRRRSPPPLTGEPFKAMLHRLGLSQTRAAPLIGVSERHVKRICAGEYYCPQPAANLMRLILRYDLDPEEFM
jgi:DNA-binding transcriptional regulator YiaG